MKRCVQWSGDNTVCVMCVFAHSRFDTKNTFRGFCAGTWQSAATDLSALYYVFCFLLDTL